MNYSILEKPVSATMVKVLKIYLLIITTKIVHIIVILTGVDLAVDDVEAIRSKINSGLSR